MGKLLLSCVLFLFTEHVFSSYPSDKTNNIDSLLRFSRQQFMDVDITGSLEGATNALAMSEDIGYSEGKAKSYFYIAQNLYYLGEIKQSLEYLDASEKEKYTINNLDLRSEIYRIRGRIYMSLELQGASVAEFKNGLSLITKIADKEKRELLQGLAYENLSVAYGKMNVPDSSVYYIYKYRNLLDKKEESETYRNRINLYGILAEYFSSQNRYDLAVYYFERSLALIDKYEYPYSSWIYQHWGDMENKKGKIDLALEYYYKSMHNIEKNGIKDELAGIYQRIADIYIKKGVIDSIILYNGKAEVINKEFAKSNSEALDRAMQILLQNEKEASQKKSLNRYLIISAIIIIIALLVIYKLLKSREKKICIKEDEVVELKEKLNESFDELIDLAKNDDSQFLIRFAEIYPEFTKNLYEKHPDLISSEFWLCAMIFLDFSAKEIAQYAFIEHRSVQVRKSRLRKKLNIDSSIDLNYYMKSLNYKKIPISHLSQYYRKVQSLLLDL